MNRILPSLFMVTFLHAAVASAADNAPVVQPNDAPQPAPQGPYLSFSDFRGSLLVDHPVATVWCQGIPGYIASNSWLVKFPFTEPSEWSFDERRSQIESVPFNQPRLRIEWSRPNGQLPATIQVVYGNIHHKITFLESGNRLRVNKRQQTFDLRNGKLLVVVAQNGSAALINQDAMRIQVFQHAAASAENRPTFSEWMNQ